MKTRLRIGLFIGFLGFSLLGIILLIGEKELDLSGEEAPFNSMAMPPRSVDGTMYMDGGSIWVRVVDGNGMILDLAFPYEYKSTAGTHYGKAFHGVSHATNPGAMQFRDPLRAKGIALSLLDLYSDAADLYSASAYDTLSEREIPLSSMLAYGRELLK